MRAKTLTAGLIVLALALGGCGDDSDGETTRAAGTIGNDTAGLDSNAFCEAHRNLEKAFVSQGRDIAPVISAVEDMRDSATARVTELLDPVAQALRRDGVAAFDSEAFLETEATAEEAVDELTFEQCQGTHLEITGIDYAYQGLPDRLEPGRYILDFTNESESGEAHEAFIVRKNDGVNATAQELLTMSDAERAELVRPVGAAHAGPDDRRDISPIDLEPGNYVVVCTLPVGGEDAPEDTPPHAAEGMVQEFTVD